jgi:hypothetical protein
MQVAFFKGTKSGFSGLFEIAVREWTAGSYAHAELILSDGRACSSTFLEGGVRILPPGTLDVSDPALWDVLDITGLFDEAAALEWFTAHDGDTYDSWGDAHLVVGFIREKHGAEFCSEAVAAALAFEEAWRLDPNALYFVLKRFCLMKTKAV